VAKETEDSLNGTRAKKAVTEIKGLTTGGNQSALSGIKGASVLREPPPGSPQDARGKWQPDGQDRPLDEVYAVELINPITVRSGTGTSPTTPSMLRSGSLGKRNGILGLQAPTRGEEATY
jgi:hypothetical protein